MRIPKIIVPALLAVTTLGPMAGLAAEPKPGQSVNDKARGQEGAIPRTRWSCYTVMDGIYRGTVTIWWGHTSGDAEWACNKWISTCGNTHAHCYATPRG